MKKNKEYLTRSNLKARGWTDGMIKKYLGDPDLTKVNPVFKCAAPMALYSIKRVLKIEGKAAFTQAMAKAAARSQAAQKAVETKKREALEFANNAKIVIPKMDYDRLLKKACDSYNDFHLRLLLERGHEFSYANPEKSDSRFLARIATNYLRHRCTSYEGKLSRLYGKTGIHEAHDILQSRINAAIWEVYPQLKEALGLSTPVRTGDLRQYGG